jgi:exonuclease SbcC
LRSTLAGKEQKKLFETRIAELEAEELSLNNQLSETAKLLFDLNNFNREKMEMMEAKINAPFGYVTFRLFEPLLEGGQKDACETLLTGYRMPMQTLPEG